MPGIFMSAVQYRSYPDLVKSEIARTKNVYLFPDLKIPRTTAQYWLKKQRPMVPATVVEIESVYRKKSEFLEVELAKEKAMRLLLETVRKLFPFDFGTKQLKNKQIRAQIVAAIQECSKHHKLAHCLDSIGLSKSAYRRWSSEISVCGNAKSPCGRRRAAQLTDDELSTMKKFATSKKYAYISVSSLHLLAQRTGELFCSVDSWYKYIRAFEWKRPWLKLKKEIKKTGIRATKPNEIWHIDVTEVSIGPGIKLYIQAVIDNFSRFVLAWRVTEEINAQNTVETLSLARKKASALLNTEMTSNVMMDPGRENNNGPVLQFITSKNLLRTLAQVDIHYSNSMVEGLFHSLKNKYLYHQKVKTIGDLTRKANFYFRQHNEVVPLAVHKGGRPREVFLSAWSSAELEQPQVNKTSAFLARKKKNLEPPCATCPL
jgi:putative transposase